MEAHLLSPRGLAPGGAPFAALPMEAGMGGAAAVPAMQPGMRRNTRHRNKRQRGDGQVEAKGGGRGLG